MLPYEEKRQFARVKANFAMSFKRVGCGKQARALCLNISSSGILFEADEPVACGRALEIRTFPTDRIAPSITALIEVNRCTATQEGRFRISGAIKGIKSQAPDQASP